VSEQDSKSGCLIRGMFWILSWFSASLLVRARVLQYRSEVYFFQSLIMIFLALLI